MSSVTTYPVRRPSLRRWTVTLAATAVSTYALDAIATAAGVLLAASQLLNGLGHGAVLAFLGATYVVWGAGLGVNLAANGRLLERTGTSTNAPSKALFDLTRSRSPRTRRIAAATGYVATELVKEAPYYAGAFGATLVSDSIGAHEALVFLGGANLGAAAYEYGLARLTRAFLDRRRHASFDTDWDPAEYLTDYYREVERDEVETISFFVDALRNAEPGRPVLLFGVGPTLHHVFLAARHASELHLADYLPGNLREIERWLAREPGAHDWRPFVRYTLQCEGIANPTDEQVTEREELTREKVTRLLRVDANEPEPVDERYATVISAYCADSATDDRATWERFMAHIAGLVSPGGVFITSALRRCRHYVVGGKRFPSANVDENDLQAVLAGRFTHATIEARHVAEHAAQGYSGVVLAWAR